MIWIFKDNPPLPPALSAAELELLKRQQARVQELREVDKRIQEEATKTDVVKLLFR